MQRFHGYAMLEPLAETRKSRVHRARGDEKPDTVIIKVLKTENPTPSDIARFRQEYRLIKKLDIDGVVRVVDFLEHKDGFALVMEDFNGVSLRDLLQERGVFGLRSFLEIAIQLAETLGRLHDREVAHRDLKPGNILLNPSTGEVKISDFGIAAELTHENEDIYSPAVIQGSLAYVSPEQTGRMNRTVDHRTDFYSLGVTFYEMLTGVLPFSSDDPMAVIHAHLAIMPKPPAQRRPELPEMVSAIVIKLLSKNAEDRYQNGFGLAADLKECLTQLEQSRTVATFPLGRKDISNRFLIPPKLFGREAELDVLVSSFEKLYQSGGGVQVMLVSGYSGIGKSALIGEIHKPIVARRGYFIAGKYEQFRRDKPYSAVIQAFAALTKQILAESDERIARWKEKLLVAVGPNGKVITDIIPEIELIIGKQPELAELGPEETRNRFRYVFERVVCAFPTAEHPVALFLDDLQWADIPSLQLIRNMTTSAEMNYLYLIGSYRDNEVDETHPLSDTVREIEKSAVPVGRINLLPLLESDIQDLVINFLKCSPSQGRALAALLHRKTGGNPFFVIQFLETLYNERLIRLNPLHGWDWDIESIQRLNVTDNVVELMAAKIDKQPAAVREVLKICAALGNRFDLEVLATLMERPIDEVLERLNEAIQVGFISLLPEGELYTFHHDRIQEAAYSLVPDGEKAALHYRIGRKAIESVKGDDDLDRKLFYIVDQLNFGSSQIADPTEREQLARLNLKAGVKAKASSAFFPALRYLETGISLLPEGAWKHHYELTRALHTEITEAAYLVGDFDRMDELAEAALAHAVSTLDKVKITISRVNARRSKEDFHGSIEAALPILRLLGLHMSKHTTKLRVGLELLGVRIALLGQKLDDLLDLPPMRDPKAIATMQVLADLGLTSFFVNPNLLALDIIKAFKLSMRYGNSPDTVFAYAGFGVVLVGGLWEFDSGVAHGELGLKLIARTGERKQLAKTLFVNNVIFNHWKRPLKETIAPLLEGYRVGLETGDTNFAAFCLHMSDVVAYFVGRPLAEMDAELAKHIRLVKGLNQKYITTLLSLKRQNVLNLLGKSEDPTLLTGEAIRAEETVPTWIRANNALALSVFHFKRMITRFVFNEYGLVLEDVKGFRKYKDAMQGVFVNRYVNLYESIARLLEYPAAAFFKKLTHRFRVGVNQLIMKFWARHAPANCAHKVHLVEAVRLWRVKRDLEGAQREFERALELCKRPDDVIVEATALELMAMMRLSVGDLARGKVHIAAAYNAYASWGALAKLKQLREKYPDLLGVVRHADAKDATMIETSAQTMSHALDLSSAMKASHAIAGEIVLERLLVKLLELTMENAGADRAVMLLEADGKLFVEAEKGRVDHGATVLQAIPVEAYQQLSPSIAKYVARTREILLLNDALHEGDFTSDPYLQLAKPKSLLCLPIVGRGRLLGVLWLENNLAIGAFTPERVELLRVISSQAAISIENARLLSDREKAAVLEKEMEIAANIQTSLLPKTPAVDGHDIAAYMEPADEVGGDYYDVFRIGDVDWIIIGDVSGHGVPAGLVMMMTQTAIHSVLTARPKLTPAELLTTVNTVIAENIKRLGEEKYMTITALACHDDGEFRHAGMHQDILIYRAASGTVDPVETSGVWVGLMPDVQGMMEDGTVKLAPGDVMLLYTDGITEAVLKGEGAARPRYGDARLAETLARLGQDGAQQIRDGILATLADYECPDDVTMVVVKRQRAPAS